MWRNSSYTRSASCFSAASSPPLQAFNKPVTSTDRGSTVILLQKKIPRPWPVFPSASACSGGGGRGDENHERGGDGGDGWDQRLGRFNSGCEAAGNGLHERVRECRVGEPGQGGCVQHLRRGRRENRV